MSWRLRGVANRRAALAGALLLAASGLLAVLGPTLAGPRAGQMFEPMLSPSRQHLLGTDDIGQDILSELLQGARASLFVAGVSAVLSTAGGVLVGLISGYYPRLGFALMRVVDAFLCVPRFPLIILMAAFLRPGPGALVLFFVLFGWAGAARLLRSQVLTERNAAYVEAARAVGARDRRILLRHILPATVPIAVVRLILEFQHVLLAESGLSFLGLGDPTLKSWGTMLYHASQSPVVFISGVWLWWVVPPGGSITLVVLGLALLGLGLDAWSDPRRSG